MNIGENAESILLLDVGEHLHALLQTWTTIRMDTGAVSFVERRLEDDVKVILLIQPHQLLSHLFEAFHRLNHTRTRNDGWLHVS